MNLVLTIAVGAEYQRMLEISGPRMQAYARKIGADFIAIDKCESTTPHWEKFKVFNLLSKYERIIYVDVDTLIREDCPNLFDLVPAADLGLFDERPFTRGREISIYDTCKQYGVTLPRWNGKYFNTGVMVIPRAWKSVFKKPVVEEFSFYEQGYLNMRIHEQLERAGNELRVFDLPYRLNRMTCMDVVTGEDRFASYIMHYAGYPSLSWVLGVMLNDEARWQRDAEAGYQYRRHLYIAVNGGLGDQVEAQPAVRYLCEKIYPGQDIVIETHFPCLFEELADSGAARVFEHGQFERPGDTPFLQMQTLPGPETSLWAHVSHLLCHTADYCAMALLKRTLPNAEKSIRLKVKTEDLESVAMVCGLEPEQLRELTLVHAGRHWPSKTFPLEWWQNVVDRLAAEGETVCLIGRNELTRGVVPVVARDGMIDCRDLLSLEELIALLSRAKKLVSNDSAPVHLAGAFDNEIVLFPSCKHPDHVLPYRNGRTDYKVTALYKKLTIDDVKYEPGDANVPAHEMNGDWGDYLP